MKRVKLFSTIKGAELTDAVNDFIKNKVVYDIKFTSLLVHTGDGTAVNDRALVIYEEQETDNV